MIGPIGTSAIGGSGPRLAIEVGERLAIAFGECAARHRQIGDDEHAVGDGFAVAIAPVLRHRFERMTRRMTEVQNAARDLIPSRRPRPRRP